MTRKYFLLPGVAILTLPVLESMGIAAQDGVKKTEKKYALLIGVNGYEADVPKGQETPWVNLHTAADVWSIKRVLMDKFSFQDKNVAGASDFTVLVKREDTTKAKILKALENLAAVARPGDTVYIHYSGHGDDSRKYGQTLVPSDWYNPADPKDNKDSKHVTSAELATRITAIRNALQTGDPTRVFSVEEAKAFEKTEKRVSLTVALDCCHSGHLLADVRGGQGPRVRGRNNLTCPHTDELGSEPRPTPACQTTAPPSDGALPASVFTGVRGFSAFLACRYNEVAGEIILKTPAQGAVGEGEFQGYLTYALVEAFKQAGPETTTGDIAAQLQTRLVAINPDQHPVLVGDRDTALLKGKARKDPLAFQLSASEKSPGQWEVNAGSLHFVTPQTQFALYKRGTKQLTTPNQIGTAKVVKVSATKSVVTLVSGDKKLLAQPLLAVPVRPYGDQPLLVTLDGTKARGAEAALSSTERSFFESTLKGLGSDGLAELGGRDKAQLELVKVVGGFDLRRIDAQGAAARIPALDASGQVIPGPTIPEDTSENQKAKLLGAVNRTARAGLLRGMATARSATPYDDGGIERYPGVAVELRLVPAMVKGTKPGTEPAPGNASFVSDVPGNLAGKLEWKVGEWFTIEVKNCGSEDCFVSVFDIDPNGWVTGIYPVPGFPSTPLRTPTTPEEDKKWVKLRVTGIPLVFRVSDPPGQESLQAIATPTREGEVDLTPLADSNPYSPTRGGDRGAKGAQIPLGKLLLKNLKDGRRGPQGGFALQSQDVDAKTVGYYIVK